MELPHLDQTHPIVSRIAIVGCGMAGLLSAVLLKRRYHVTLFEQSETLEPVGAGFLLQPVGQAVLDRAGLLDPIRAQAAAIHDLRAQHVSGRELIRLPFQRRHHPHEHALGVHRGDIFQVLLNAARAAGVEPRTGARAVGWDAAGYLQFADGAREGPFDLILAADGSRSALRAVTRPRVFEYGYSVSAQVKT
ncbi:MAG: FAD-dependent monooxygenase [Acidobacteria bacterium]|nr:FAD-dependent monooxygenase [Acidobacteriota bacterium]